ncbi:MAG: apolipoprotein N-acyltransferase [Bacteroidota bacterium]
MLTGCLLAASFPPSPLNFLIYIAFVPLFILCELETVPGRVPEDKIFRPFKSFFVVAFRLLTFQFLWRPLRKGRAVFTYRRATISGNAQLFRYTYAIFLVWNALCCYWLMMTAFGATDFGEALIHATAGILAIMLNPVLMVVPFQFLSRVRHVFHPVLASGCLVIFWLAFEYLHFNWDLSWSWLTLGHTMSAFPDYIQYAEFTGVLGISLHILVGNLLIYQFYRFKTHVGKFNLLRGSVMIGWFALPLLLNLFLLNPDRPVFQSTGQYTVRVVQPNVDPYKKYNYYTAEEQVNLIAELIQSRPLDSIDLVILPETAIPRPTERNEMIHGRLLEPLWEIVDSFGVDILTGVEEYQIFRNKDSLPVSATPGYAYVAGARKAVYFDYYNAAVLLRGDRQLQSHRKGKLIPMVERTPFLEAISGFRAFKIDVGTGHGSYGLPDSIFPLESQDGLKIGAMICYESEYGDYVRAHPAKGAEMLAVLTNDGWWQQSSGYVQHAALSVLRALESRRELARAANSGTSLFVDHLGRVSQSTAFGTTAVIDQTLHRHTGTTFYTRHGDWIGRIALWLTLFASIAAIVVNYRRKKPRTQPQDPNGAGTTA